MHEAESAEFGNVMSISMKSGVPKEAIVEAVVEPQKFVGSPPRMEAEEIREKTVAEIKSDAPVQRRMLTSARRALDDEESPVEMKSSLNKMVRKFLYNRN